MAYRVSKCKGLWEFVLIRSRLAPLYPRWARVRSKQLYRECKRVLLPDSTVRWVVAAESHPMADHIELGGQKSSHIISYLVSPVGEYQVVKHSVFPLLRLLPDATEASFSYNFTQSPHIVVDDMAYTPRARYVDIRGTLAFRHHATMGVEVVDEYLPCTLTPGLIQRITICNVDEVPHHVAVQMPPFHRSIRKHTKQGPYEVCAALADEDGRMLSGFAVPELCASLKPGDNHTFYVVYYAVAKEEELLVDCRLECKKRATLIEDSFETGLSIEGDALYKAACAHAGLRAAESVLDTPVGPMHCPGGGVFYGAVWTNDSLEYSAPLAAIYGNGSLLTAQENVLNMYATYLEPDERGVMHALPTSIAAMGSRLWALAGDRGDTQMYGVALARWALLRGREEDARRVFPWVVRAVQYTASRTNKQGLVRSDSDELEGRFPTGRANLYTACLSYDLYHMASVLAEALSEATYATLWRSYQQSIEESIERVLGRRVQRYDTYRYYVGNTHLRSHIALPLSVGIHRRSRETALALYEGLYDGTSVQTSSASSVKWDRGILMAMRGLFKAGETDIASEMLRSYTQARILGNHAPYPIEAFPEGNRRQLSAESMLYVRVYSEGVFGIEPTSLHAISVCVHKPTHMREVTLRHAHIMGDVVTLRYKEGVLLVTDIYGATLFSASVPEGQPVTINIPFMGAK